MTANIDAVASTQKISDDELAKAWETRKGEFATPERRTIMQLTFKDIDSAAKAKERIVGGEDIIKVAAENGLKESDIVQPDKLRQDFLDKAIGEAAFALKEGELSVPVKGALATALLKAIKVTLAKNPSLEESKVEFVKRLQLEKAKANIQEVYNAVEDARAKSQKLEEIAKTKGLNFTILPAVSASGQNQEGQDVSSEIKPEVLKALFASDVGVDNDAIQLPDGFAWYDVRSTIPSALKPFEQVKVQVTADVVAGRVRQAATDKAKALISALQGGKDFETAAKDAGGEVKTAQGLKRDKQSDAFDGNALTAAFAVADQGFVFAAGGDGKTARIIQVVKATFPPIMATSPQLTKAKDELHGAFVNDMQSSLVEALKKSAGVKINNDLWKLVNNGEAPAVE